jgi:hypothetical protein
MIERSGNGTMGGWAVAGRKAETLPHESPPQKVSGIGRLRLFLLALDAPVRTPLNTAVIPINPQIVSAPLDRGLFSPVISPYEPSAFVLCLFYVG